jgi:chromosome segregation ATPase
VDQELIAYLDARFSETSREFREVKEMVGQLDTKVVRLDGRVEQVDAKVVRLDGRVEQVDAKVGRLDGRVEQLDAKVVRLDGRVEQVDGKAGQLQITVESMRDDIRQVAEGVIANNEKIDAFKAEVVLSFGEVIGLLRPMYMRLDNRISSLEAWRERTERDPIEMVRELLGKPKS